jgi:hypothetical protein
VSPLVTQAATELRITDECVAVSGIIFAGGNEVFGEHLPQCQFSSPT